MADLRSVHLPMSLILLYLVIVSSDVVTVIRGRPAVLQCDVDPGDSLLQVTWKLQLYKSSCVISYKIEETNTKTSYSSCRARIRSDGLSLRISNTEVSDSGLHECQVVNNKGTFIAYTGLLVLAQPSTYLKLNSDGSPECGAIGGNPPAEISWVPHSDDTNYREVEEPDQTWSVIDTLSINGMKETSVTCVVSHRTFAQPWKEVIVVNGYSFKVHNIVKITVTAILIVFMAGLLLYLKIKRQEQTLPVEQINTN